MCNAKFYQQTLLTILILLIFGFLFYTPYSFNLMNDTELLHLLALLKIEGVGDIVAKKLLNHCGSATEIFTTKASVLSSIDGVGDVLIKNLKDKTVFKLAESELKFIDDNPINLLFYQDEAYPNRLKHCIDSPVLLFASGNMNLNNRKIISIVGTRETTGQGREPGQATGPGRRCHPR